MGLSTSHLSFAEQHTRVLLDDIFGDILKANTTNDKCIPSSASGNFSFDFNFGPPYFNQRHIKEEKTLFLAEIKHEDPDSDRSWKIKIGKGGNIYSYVGALGEAMPPNTMPNSYMVDEVWQNVAVDTRLKNSAAGQYFIHQAGPGQNGPELQMPYAFSPTVAHFCSEIDRECRFASWGMVNPTPTKYRTKALFMTRYRDCGDGILEITALVHNFDNKDAADLDDYPVDHSISTNFNYMSFPWFGVNEQVYRDVLLRANYGDQAETDWITQWPVQQFGSSSKGLSEFGGFTTMAEFRRHDSVVFPGLDQDPDIIPSFVIESRCETHRSVSLRFEAYHVRCRLHASSMLLDIVSSKRRCISCELTFTNSITNNSIDVLNVHAWSTGSGKNTFIFFAPNMQEDEPLQDYDGSFANEVADHVNGALTPNSKIQISWKDSGLHDDDNQCLVLIHGDGRIGATSGTDLFQHGSAGSFKRKYMVMNEIHRRTLLAGSSFGRRTYLLTGKGIESTKNQADNWVSNVVEDLIDIGEYPSTSIHLYMNKGMNFGVTHNAQPCLGTAVCSGYSTPTVEHGTEHGKLFTFPHFQISCGNRTYFGPDVYHFALSNKKEEQFSLVCDESDYSVRPALQLIGFFAEDDCSELENATYDETYHCGKWVACGYKCPVMESYLTQGNELHAVRCCSDTAKLGWTKNKNCDVWSASRLSGEKCFDSAYDAAKQICEANDARLCTKDEVENLCTRRSGCGHDREQVWVFS